MRDGKLDVHKQYFDLVFSFRELVPRRWVIGTQRFETKLWSHLQGSKCRIRMSGTIIQ